MWGAFLVFCACLGVFFWHLMVEADKEQDDGQRDLVDGGPQQQGERSRKRNRKKGRQHGGRKPGSKEQQSVQANPSDSTAASTGAKASSLGRKATAAKQPTLDVKEWPTLGGRPSQSGAGGRVEEQEEEEEDLAALHASMLKAAQAPASVSDATSAVRGRKSGRIGVGDKVEARFEAGMEWFPAIVTKTLHGGLVNLLYDDGGRETKVPLSLVRHRGAQYEGSSDCDASSEPDSDSAGETVAYSAPIGLPTRPQGGHRAGAGWEVTAPKPKKTSQERVEARAETSVNVKNRIKRQKKRQKELAAREALRQKL